MITLSPIIMEVENYKNERKLELEGPIFHFHDYGTKVMVLVKLVKKCVMNMMPAF